MDIIVHNIPSTVTQKQLRTSFIAPLRECGIEDFHCQLPRAKKFAFITLLKPSDGQRFLSLYGVPQNALRSFQPKKSVTCSGARLRCQASRNEPTEFDIRALQHEATKRAAEAVVTAPQDTKHTRKFNVSRVHCGMWGYDDSSQLVFDSHFTLVKTGNIVFGLREAVLLLGDIGTDQVRMDINYYSCDNVALDDHRSEPTLTFTLRHSPKFYKVKGEDVIEAGFRALAFGPDIGRMTTIEKSRVLGFNDAHQKIAGACRVYQIRLSGSNVLPNVRSLLQSTTKMPSQISFATPLRYPVITFERAYNRLETQLIDTGLFGKLPFPVKFQMDRMARNGFLAPLKVIELLPTVRNMTLVKGSDVVAHALRNLARSLPVPGPDTCKHYSASSLETELLSFADDYDSGASDNPYKLVKRHKHVKLVHRAVITPTGFYLEGPDPEPQNRVLRRYSQHIDHFIRVVLCDEDGGSVRYDPGASQRMVYDDRFREMLTKPLFIAGKAYDFFGFSNSALRSHSCWFMAPIPTQGPPFYAALVLKELGNFEMIRTPAKCAARIGQNFTVTSTATTNVEQC
jgi:hypothetical protein